MSRARDLSNFVNPAAISVDGSFNVGINSQTPDATLDVVGVVSATSFTGDGANLSNVSASSATTAEGLTGTPDIDVRNVTGVAATFTGNVSIAGTLTYEDVTNVDSIGIITARQGVVIGTGASVGNPDNNELGLYTDSSERVRIDSSGRLLVGTTSSPSDSNGSLSLSVIQGNTSSATGAGYLSLQRGQAAASIGSGAGLGLINFGDSAGESYAYIQALSDATGGTDDYPGRLIFATTSDSGDFPTERMRIDSSGNVGIGTDNSTDKLSVVSSLTTDSVLRLQGGNSAGKGSGIRLMKGSSAVGFIGPESWLFGSANTSDTLVISQNAQANVSVTSAGLVGIGLTNPGHALSVRSGTANTAIANFTGATIGRGLEIATDNDGGTGDDTVIYNATQNSGSHVFQVDADEKVRIDSSGRLLVGNTQDSAPFSWGLGLQVSGTSTNAGLSIRRDQDSSGGALLMFIKSRGSLNGNTVVEDGDQIGGMYFNAADGTDVNSYAAQISAEIDGTPGSNDVPGRLIFKTTADGASSPTEALRIDRSGRIGIGITSPSTPLHVLSSSGTQLTIERTSSVSDYTLKCIRGNKNDQGIYTDGAGISLRGEDASNGTTQVRLAGANTNANDFDRIEFTVEDSERMRLDNRGRLIIGTTSAGNLSTTGGLRVVNGSSAGNDYVAEFQSNAAVLMMFRSDGYVRSQSIQNRTSGGAANVFIDGDGYMYRSTSSQRYKRDIVSAGYTLDQIADLRAVTFKSNVVGADGNISDRIYGGLIAEEVDAAGLQEFVNYDDQGRPDEIQYGNMISVAIKGLQEAHSRIKDLEAKVAALESE